MKILSILILLLMSGCVGRNAVNGMKSLKDDPAIVTLKIRTIYGTVEATRIGVQAQTNRTVNVLTDGSILIKPGP